MVRICSITSCEKIHYGNGFCLSHNRYFKKYGDPLRKADPEKRRKAQSEFMKKNNPMKNEKSRKKLSETKTGVTRPDLIGKKHTQETIEKIRVANTGKKVSEESRRKMSISQKKTYENGRVSHRKGVILTQEQKDSHSAKMKGMSPWIMDNIVSDATKQIISKKKTGSKDSEEAKLNKKKAHNRPDKLEESRLIGIATNADPIKKAKQKASLKKTYSTEEGSAMQFERGKKAKPNSIPKATEVPTIKILEEAGIRFKHHKDVHIAEHKKYGLRPTKNIDFLIRPNKIIEVNGTYDHADNRKYKADDLIRNHGKKIPAKEIWDKEELTLNQIRKNNYKILVIWQIDLEKNYESTKKKIIEFANS
jgi:hypothetical protein